VLVNVIPGYVGRGRSAVRFELNASLEDITDALRYLCAPTSTELWGLDVRSFVDLMRRASRTW
jgi:hypothetical protein